MQWISSGLFGAVALSLTALGPPAQAPDGSADAAVRSVVAEYLAAREARDPAAVAALFTADADQLTSSGDWRRGREEVVTGSLASSDRNAGRRTLTVDRLRLVGDDVAIADCRYVIAEAAGGERNMWSTFVLSKADGRWRIEAIRNMLPAAPAAAPR